MLKNAKLPQFTEQSRENLPVIHFFKSSPAATAIGEVAQSDRGVWASEAAVSHRRQAVISGNGQLDCLAETTFVTHEVPGVAKPQL